jgi:predicted nucleotidyltransferase
MGTKAQPASLDSALFGKTRRAVLALLYSHPDEAFYLRQLIRAAGVGQGGVQREVRRLSAAGLIQRTVRGHQVYYQADPRCPVFKELKSLVVKTAGVGDVLRAALAPLAERIRVAFLFGSMARGETRRGSDLDLLVVGKVSFGDVVSALGAAQAALRREVNPTLYSPAEFQTKCAARHHFLTTVLREKKIFLVGDERELARLAQKRLAGRARKQR